MKKSLLPLATLGLSAFILSLGGCLSSSEVGAPFHGLWKERETHEYTLRDSLYRVGLTRYSDELGFYLPLDLDPWEKPPAGKLPLPDSLWFAFRYDCERSDCDSVLESWRYYIRIEGDSLRRYYFLNGKLESAYTYGFRVDRDSIYESIGSINFEFASGFRLFANGDSLELEEIKGIPRFYGRSRDVLPPN